MRGIAVLDFGSQFTQLIARRFRELKIYTEIFPYNVDIKILENFNPIGIVLSGGPNSIYEDNAPKRSVKELMQISPILGICYGMQLIAKELGGVVEKTDDREYGSNEIIWNELWPGIAQKQKVWMSHGDIVKVPPNGMQVIAHSQAGHISVIKGDKILAVQFHPEVSHTIQGIEILKSYAFDFCGGQALWTNSNITQNLIKKIQIQIPDKENILCALSGGVDSSVVAILLSKALGSERVHCVFIDNGLLRKNEFETVLNKYLELGLNVKGINASNEFLQQLSGIEDPETKRKIIGKCFVDIFEKSIIEENLNNIKWLAQGTLYPDVIESVSIHGSSMKIKSHHNVGGLPERMKLKLIEPLRELFKDEVRHLGQDLGLPHEILWRHPFPGPGLAIRIIGNITKDKLNILRSCDEIYIDTLKQENIYDSIWQAFCVLLPIKTVGVQGDARTYDYVVSLRAVSSVDGMTADWFSFSDDFLRRLSNRLTNEVKGINRVVLDITSKPPSTIEWE